MIHGNLFLDKYFARADSAPGVKPIRGSDMLAVVVIEMKGDRLNRVVAAGHGVVIVHIDNIVAGRATVDIEHDFVVVVLINQRIDEKRAGGFSNDISVEELGLVVGGDASRKPKREGDQDQSDRGPNWCDQ